MKFIELEKDNGRKTIINVAEVKFFRSWHLDKEMTVINFGDGNEIIAVESPAEINELIKKALGK